jgi:hypothetical protein
MRARADLLIAGILVALCTFVVLKHVGLDPFASDAPAVRALGIGERLEPDFRLRGIGDTATWHNPADLFGSRGTVLMSWSVKCPCVSRVEQRLRELWLKTGGNESGIGWLAYNGEPAEDHVETREQMARQYAFYQMLLDPGQRLARRLGVRQATQVVVLDADARVVYRGAIDHDYYEGHAEALAKALEAVLAGRAPEPAETPYAYGCPFDDPESCEEYKQRDAERDAPAASPPPASEPP